MSTVLIFAKDITAERNPVAFAWLMVLVRSTNVTRDHI